MNNNNTTTSANNGTLQQYADSYSYDYSQRLSVEPTNNI